MSMFTIPPTNDEQTRRFYELVAQTLDNLCGQFDEGAVTSNPQQGVVEDVQSKTKEGEKINEILQVLRRSNIIK